ncbi:hypothetical protein DFH07DRAFT_893085 [Mycena maculata]|uniref:Golgi apparatus membrane protein TVP38 n=1 Tax=Mycena maculata TaxID=230809 RepID=A0AAD7I926_9AGAR|nr:hypothetical protein DFH07DRAFT_893085 [Mycena maculata]
MAIEIFRFRSCLKGRAPLTKWPHPLQTLPGMSDEHFTPPVYNPPAYAAPTPGGYSQNYTYIPTHNADHSVSMSTLHDDGSTLHDGPEISRTFSRTPSPTPSEFNALNGIKEQKTTKQLIIRYAVVAVLVAVTVVISLENKNIIKGLSPATNWMASHPPAFLIPIAFLILLSFPPLFGGEIVAILVGVTWSLPVGFLIAAAGTLLGEISNFFVFKSFCTGRSEKMEKSQLSYALLAHVVRHGGFLVVLVVRYSAVPPHFATAIFSTVGISFFIFLAAAILSLPKQLVSVYVGWAMKPGNDTSTSNKIEKIVLIISVIITVIAMVWLRRQQEAAKPVVIYARRKARQGKLLRNTAYNADQPYNV